MLHNYKNWREWALCMWLFIPTKLIVNGNVKIELASFRFWKKAQKMVFSKLLQAYLCEFNNPGVLFVLFGKVHYSLVMEIKNYSLFVYLTWDILSLLRYTFCVGPFALSYAIFLFFVLVKIFCRTMLPSKKEILFLVSV